MVLHGVDMIGTVLLEITAEMKHRNDLFQYVDIIEKKQAKIIMVITGSEHFAKFGLDALG